MTIARQFDRNPGNGTHAVKYYINGKAIILPLPSQHAQPNVLTLPSSLAPLDAPPLVQLGAPSPPPSSHARLGTPPSPSLLSQLDASLRY